MHDDLYNLSREELETEYRNNTVSGLARKYGVSNHFVLKRLKEFGITRKTHLEASRLANKRPKPVQKKLKYAYSLLINYDWLYEHRITKRLSKEDIAKIVNASPTLVNKFLKLHNIPEVRYNECESAIKAKLENKNYLTSLYQNMTFDQIADELGTCKRTIADAFIKLGITPKAPNSYDRKFIRISKGHTEIVSFINEICDLEVLVNNRSIIGTEIDILIPEKKLGIEFNGLFYHHERENARTESLRKGRFYHLNKTTLCAEKGYNLFHIFSDSWENKPHIIKSMIKSKLGITKTVGARKLRINEVCKKEAKKFLEKNHIQGPVKSNITYGLYKGSDLICVASFGTPRFNKNYDWELLRFASKLGITCVGGFSRLLSHFEKNHEGSIISYSDKTYSNGAVYLKNGFSLLKTNSPGYFYTDSSFMKRYNRLMLSKKNLCKKFGINAVDKSEQEIAKILRFKRVWDCGTDVWIRNFHS